MKNIGLDMKRTVLYLIGDSGAIYDNDGICSEEFERARMQSLLSMGRLSLAVWFLATTAELSDTDKLKTRLDECQSRNTPPLCMLIEKIGADIIGPCRRTGSNKLNYHFGEENIRKTSLVKNMKNLFSEQPSYDGIFQEISAKLRKKIQQEKNWRKVLKSTPSLRQDYSLDDVDSTILALAEAQKLTHRVKLSAQACLHEASAIRQLHLLASKLNQTVTNAQKLAEIESQVEALLKLYQKYQAVDYSFEDNVGLQIKKEVFTRSDVLLTRGKKLSAIFSKLNHCIQNLEPIDIDENNCHINFRDQTKQLSVGEFKRYLTIKLSQSRSYYYIKSEVLESFASFDSKFFRAINVLLTSGTWAGLVGALGMAFGGVLVSFVPPLLPLGQGMVLTGLTMAGVGVISAIYIALRGTLYTPIKYGASPQLGEVILTAAMVAGFTAAGSLKLLSAQQFMSELAVGILSGINGLAKLPLQTGGFIMRRNELQLQNSEEILQHEQFISENLTIEQIVHFLHHSNNQQLHNIYRALDIQNNTALTKNLARYSEPMEQEVDDEGYQEAAQVQEPQMEVKEIATSQPSQASLLSSSMPVIRSGTTEQATLTVNHDPVVIAQQSMRG